MVYPVMLHKAGELGCSVLAVGGVEDHVHLLVSMPATVTISEVVKHIKGASSRAVHLASPDLFFKWQGSYGAISVSPKAIPAIIRYIEGQAEHHRRNELHPEWETAEDSQEVNNDS